MLFLAIGISVNLGYLSYSCLLSERRNGRVSESQCHSAAMSQRHHVTASPRHSVTPSQCLNATTSHCHTPFGPKLNQLRNHVKRCENLSIPCDVGGRLFVYYKNIFARHEKQQLLLHSRNLGSLGGRHRGVISSCLLILKQVCLIRHRGT